MQEAMENMVQELEQLERTQLLSKKEVKSVEAIIKLVNNL